VLYARRPTRLPLDRNAHPPLLFSLPRICGCSGEAGLSRLVYPALMTGSRRTLRPRALLLDSVDLRAQPASQSFFHLDLSTAAVKIVHRLPAFLERNETAGDLFVPVVRRNEINQQTLLAGMAASGIAEVGTDG